MKKFSSGTSMVNVLGEEISGYILLDDIHDSLDSSRHFQIGH